MKNFNEFLQTEKFVNALTPATKRKLAPDVWAILQDAYASIGGFKSAANPDELVTDSHLWKAVRIKDKIVAIAVYKKKHGRKAIGYGSDGSAEGKKGIKEIMIDDLKRGWVESSGAVEKFLMRNGGKKYLVPNTRAAQLTGKEILNLDPDGYHYTRLIAGKPHVKVIIGTPG
jgi:hypothetical protein